MWRNTFLVAPMVGQLDCRPNKDASSTDTPAITFYINCFRHWHILTETKWSIVTLTNPWLPSPDIWKQHHLQVPFQNADKILIYKYIAVLHLHWVQSWNSFPQHQRNSFTKQTASYVQGDRPLLSEGQLQIGNNCQTGYQWSNIEKLNKWSKQNTI